MAKRERSMKALLTITCVLFCCAQGLGYVGAAGPVTDDPYGLDGVAGSPLSNVLLAPEGRTEEVASAPEQKISSLSMPEEQPTAVAAEAVQDASAEEKSADLFEMPMAAAPDWKSPFEGLLDLPAEQWELSDSLLVQETSFALMEAGVIEKIRHLRKETRTLWLEWKKAQTKNAPFVALTKQIQKLADKPDMFPGADQALAEWIVLADIDADHAKYRELMLKLTGHVSYSYLLMSVLGAPSFDAKAARTINGVSLSDVQCRNRFFSILAAFYRREYDTRYQAARDYQALAYGKRFSMGQSDLLLLEEAEYLGSGVPESVKLSAGFNLTEWQEVLKVSRIRAHEETRNFVQKKLDNIGNTLFLFQARLESVRMPESFFQYPDALQASPVALNEKHIFSLLVGMLYRLAERMCRGQKVSVMDYADIQTVMAWEYKGQRTSRHILLGVPAGEKNGEGGLPSASSKPFEIEQRRSFEARLGLLLGDIDFFEPKLLAPSVKEALSSLGSIQEAAKLYKTLMLHNAFLNGLAWGVIPAHQKTGILKNLREGVAVARSTVERFGLSVENQEAIKRSYRQLLDAINVWGPHSAFTYKSVFGLTGAGRRKITQVKCSGPVYQALYKLLWLYVWSRFQGLVSLQGQGRSVHKTAAEVSLRGADVVFDEKGMLRTDIAAAQEKKSGEPSAVQKVRDYVTDTSATISHRVQQGITKLGVKGDVEGAVDEALNGLSDMANLINNMKAASVELYDQSDKGYNRVLATTKALVVYTHHLSEFATKKIGKVQKGIRDLADFWMVKAAVFFTKLPGVKTAFRNAMAKFLFTVQEGDDAQEERRMKEAMIDVQRAMRGEIDADKIVLPTHQSRVLEDIKKRASMTLEGRDKAVGAEYNLDEEGQAAQPPVAVQS